jgi:hypothetical protein
LPELLTVTDCAADEPSLTLPKLKLLLLNDRVCEEAMPVPLNAIAAGELGALLIIEALPEAEPAEPGVNCKLKVLDCPPFRTMGRLSELLAKPLPVTPICEMIRVPVPLLLT